MVVRFFRVRPQPCASVLMSLAWRDECTSSFGCGRADAMIIDGTATLVIYSDTLTAAEVTDALGITPTEAHEKGDPTRAGIAGRPLRADRLTYQRAQWSLEAPQPEDQPDDTELASVSRLVDIVKHKADELRALRATCETIIWWYGSSDNSQGGFVMTAGLLADLGSLGCDLYGTAYLDDAEEDA